MDGPGYPLRIREDGTAVQTAPTHCPNGHELRYPNVIVAHWPKPGSGTMVRAWHCLTCKATVYDG